MILCYFTHFWRFFMGFRLVSANSRPIPGQFSPPPAAAPAPPAWTRSRTARRAPRAPERRKVDLWSLIAHLLHQASNKSMIVPFLHCKLSFTTNDQRSNLAHGVHHVVRHEHGMRAHDGGCRRVGRRVKDHRIVCETWRGVRLIFELWHWGMSSR